MARSLYEILGCARTATTEEIRAAYKRQARNWHPDTRQHAEEKKAAEAELKSINCALGVLADATRRAEYDEFGAVALEPGFDLASARAERDRPPPSRGQRPTDYSTVLVITPECVAYGCVASVSVPSDDVCTGCRGSGVRRGTCGDCHGHRMVTWEGWTGCRACGGTGWHPWYPACPACNGLGTVRQPMILPCQSCNSPRWNQPCLDCLASGRGWRQVTGVRIPAGAGGGRRIILRGEGPLDENGDRTDVYVTVIVRAYG